MYNWKNYVVLPTIVPEIDEVTSSYTALAAAAIAVAECKNLHLQARICAFMAEKHFLRAIQAHSCVGSNEKVLLKRGLAKLKTALINRWD